MFPKVTGDGWRDLGEIGERVNNIPMGCCVLRIEPSNAEDGFSDRIVIPLWRSLHSLNLMLAKEDRSAMLLRIFNDTTPLINNQINKKPPPESEAAPGFKIEDGEVKVETNGSLEANAPIESQNKGDLEMKPGPYSTIVADKDSIASTGKDVKATKIEKGEDTGGPEQQLNGTGGVEGQLGGVS
jgi:multisite-specific tRNA:(cytosine-C5)-methyltransferase